MSVVVERLEFIIELLKQLIGISNLKVTWQGIQQVVNTDRSLLRTRSQLGIRGTLTSLTVQVLSGSPDRGEIYVRMSLLDRNNNDLAQLGSGYLDVTGQTVWGNGAVLVREDDQIQVESWSAVAATILPRGIVLRDRYIAGGWAGLQENSLSGRGRMVLNADETVDDSDKTFTIPTNVRANVCSLWVEYTATSTVGSRVMEVHYRDTADDVIGGIRQNANITASQVARLHAILHGALSATAGILPTEGTSAANVAFAMVLPDMDWPEGFDIRVLDVAAIAEGFDDMITEIMTEEWIQE